MLQRENGVNVDRVFVTAPEELQYFPFCADFGPMNFGMTYRCTHALHLTPYTLHPTPCTQYAAAHQPLSCPSSHSSIRHTRLSPLRQLRAHQLRNDLPVTSHPHSLLTIDATVRAAPVPTTVHIRSMHRAVSWEGHQYVYVVPWSEFPIVPSYPHTCSAMVGVSHRPLLPSLPTTSNQK